MKNETNGLDFHNMELRKRTDFLKQIDFSFSVNPVVALLGPRQCGKTTLARMYISQQKGIQEIHYFDLEDPEDLNLLQNPKLILVLRQA